jgi:hypothetical protein
MVSNWSLPAKVSLPVVPLKIAIQIPRDALTRKPSKTMPSYHDLG